MVKKVLYPGSFDPWHVGHQFVWKSACELVGEENVWIGLATDVKKFKPSEQFPSSISKCEFLKWALVPLKAQTIVVKNTSVETCREIEASFMVRGLRPSYDLPQEAALDFWNKKLSRGNIKTMFFMTPDNINHLSSTAIREMVSLDSSGKSIQEFVNPYIIGRWKNNGVPKHSLYFGPKCAGKSTYCKALMESKNCTDTILDCDKTIWNHIKVGAEDRKNIENSFRKAILERDILFYGSLMDGTAKLINWEKFLTPDYSYEVSALGEYWKYIPEDVIGKFNLVKINASYEDRMKRAEKRGCDRTIASFDIFYSDPPFWDKEVII